MATSKPATRKSATAQSSLRPAFGFLISFVLIACDKGGAAGNEPAAGGLTYEAVTVTRPEPPDGPFLWPKLVYDLCVVVAELKKLPVKPFPKVPADFYMSKETVVTDGKSYLKKTEVGYEFSLERMTMENGCEATFTKVSGYNLQLTHKEKVTTIDVVNGEKTVTTEDIPSDLLPYLESNKSKDGTLYTVPKTVNNIKLLCMPNLLPGTTIVDGIEICVYENTKVLTDLQGSPTTLYLRMTPPTMTPQYPYEVITKPLSVTKRAAGDVNSFNVDAYLR